MAYTDIVGPLDSYEASGTHLSCGQAGLKKLSSFGDPAQLLITTHDGAVSWRLSHARKLLLIAAASLAVLQILKADRSQRGFLEDPPQMPSGAHDLHLREGISLTF